MKRISAKESEQRWDFLRKRKRIPVRNTGTLQGEEDPFDCSDLCMPPTKGLVDECLEECVQEWKELDQRKVPQEVVSSSRKRSRASKQDHETGENYDNSGNSTAQQQQEQEPKEPTGHRLPNWGWHANRLRMPDRFDYATRQSSPPPIETSSGDRVVSLANPLLQVSYEHELWNLFHHVPTVTELEQAALEGAACQHTRKLHQEITQALSENSRLDGHALSRLRHRDRHGLPFPTNDAKRTSTVRFECWRRRLRRGSSPDCHRTELEFRASQTLLDVHKAIVDLSQDDLWKSSDNGEVDSGMFFIEGTFYTTGAVDYAASIVAWLNGGPKAGGSTDKLSRRYYLGLSPEGPLHVKRMAETRLDQLNLRLGIRYHHVHHGDVECSVFCTDIRWTREQPFYPIVHDVWSPSYPVAECEACKRMVAAVVVPAGPMTKGGPTALCHSCARQLCPEQQVQQPYNVYREQEDLSVGHEPDKALF